MLRVKEPLTFADLGLAPVLDAHPVLAVSPQR